MECLKPPEPLELHGAAPNVLTEPCSLFSFRIAAECQCNLELFVLSFAVIVCFFPDKRIFRTLAFFKIEYIHIRCRPIR